MGLAGGAAGASGAVAACAAAGAGAAAAGVGEDPGAEGEGDPPVEAGAKGIAVSVFSEVTTHVIIDLIIILMSNLLCYDAQKCLQIMFVPVC